MQGFFQFGDWVNGGCWGTVEGRAILGYYRVGAFEDVRRSAERAMKWAKEFRMDAPWSQRGENTNNSWSDSTGHWQVGGVAVMIDNFAIPAATIRGLFDYDYRFDRLILRPRVPGSITEYVQKEPVRFGEKTLYISCRNGGMKVKSVAVNGKPLKVESPDAADLPYDELAEESQGRDRHRRRLGRRTVAVDLAAHSGRDKSRRCSANRTPGEAEKALCRAEDNGQASGRRAERRRERAGIRS